MLRRILPGVFIFAVLIGIAMPAFAWDDTGHKITAYIAWQRMTPEVREKVNKILLAAPEDSNIAAFFVNYGSRTVESRRRDHFMLMATWADMVRDNKFPVRSKNYHHGNWHYDDTFWQWKDGKAVFIDKPEDGGVGLTKLADFNQLIRSNATDAEKAVAIVWMEHIIGDLHQPLHTSAKVTDTNPKGDQGGNLFLLTPKGTPRANQQNLHWYWDSIVSRNIPNTKDLCDADYIDPLAQELMKLHPYDKLKSNIEPAKFDLWAKESLNFATTEVYKDLKWFEMPSDKYMKRAFEIAQGRLALAGYRMGDLFNEAFAAMVTTPTTVPAK